MPDDQVQFLSPTTGKVQPVPPEHWQEALASGYTPTTHKVMYSPTGERGMVPNGQLSDFMKQGYQTTPKTQFEQGVTGSGITLEGAGTEALNKIKGMFPPPAGPVLSKRFWVGKGPSMDFSKGGLAQAGREAAHEYERSTAAGSNPVAAAGSAAVVGAGSLGTGLSNIEQEQLAEKGEGGKILGQSAVPAVAAAAGPFMEAPLRAVGDLTPPGATSAADVAGAVLHPKTAALKYVTKKLFGEPEAPPAPPPNPFPGATSSATPVGNAPLPPAPEGPAPTFPKVQKMTDIRAAARASEAAAKQAAKEAVRKGGMTPPPDPFAGATSTAAPIGNAPLPEVPQGSPTPFPTVQPKAKVAPGPATESAGAGPTGTSLLSRGRTLVIPGMEPDLNNPVHVKMINDYQTMSGPDLRALAGTGDRFAAFVLRHMPRPQ